MDKSNITKATLGRLPMYLKYLERLPQEEGHWGLVMFRSEKIWAV